MEISYEKISRKFGVPVENSRGKFFERESLVLALKLGEKRGNGEVAPWENFECESLESAENELKKIISETRNSAAGTTKLAEILSDKLFEKSFPCLRNALETALFFAENPSFLNVPEPKISEISQLVFRNKESAPEEIAEKICRSRERTSGTVFKVKIGFFDAKKESDFCTKILEIVSKKFPEIRLRFDANGKFRVPEDLKFFEKIFAFPCLEFLEQPLEKSSGNDEYCFSLPKKFGEIIALDESLREPWRVPENSNCVAIVKPLLCSNFSKLRGWLSRERGPQFVISTVFESEVGRNVLRFLISENRGNARQLSPGISRI